MSLLWSVVLPFLLAFAVGLISGHIQYRRYERRRLQR